jgi:hypothetical protein
LKFIQISPLASAKYRPFLALIVEFLLAVNWSTDAQAHAFGARYDLPLPLQFYLIGAGGAVALSFVIMALVFRSSTSEIGLSRIDLERYLPTRFSSLFPVTAVLQTVSVCIFLLILFAGFFGTNETLENFAPAFVWIIWWVAFAYVAALIGNFWPVVNPWKNVYEMAEYLTRRCGLQRQFDFGLSYPTWLGVWPAVGLFGIFAWFELIYEAAKQPQTLAAFILAYSIITWLGMTAFGREQWLSKGEAFSLVFEIFGRFAPIGKSHKWQLRPYASDLIVDKPCSPSMIVFILLMLSTVAFDGFKETPQWIELLRWAALDPWLAPLRLFLNDIGVDFFAVFSTVMLVLFPLTFFSVYLATCEIANEVSGGRHSSGEFSGLFIYSLVPIAIAYHLAHYLSYLLISGQLIIPLASNPFGYGWDLFGTADYRTNIGIVGAKFVWFAAVAAIVAGHVFAVGVAHIVAVRNFDTAKLALRSQYPMLALMVGYTMVSLWIFSQPILESPAYQTFREPSGFASLQPQGSAETCFDMRAGEIIEYDFQSELPVTFDIHFHDGFDNQFPVELAGITDHKNKFTANIDQVYCLLWTNHTESATTLSYAVGRQ